MRQIFTEDSTSFQPWIHSRLSQYLTSNFKAAAITVPSYSYPRRKVSLIRTLLWIINNWVCTGSVLPPASLKRSRVRNSKVGLFSWFQKNWCYQRHRHEVPDAGTEEQLLHHGHGPLLRAVPQEEVQPPIFRGKWYHLVGTECLNNSILTFWKEIWLWITTVYEDENPGLSNQGLWGDLWIESNKAILDFRSCILIVSLKWSHSDYNWNMDFSCLLSKALLGLPNV